jgi:dihydrofolate reductase
LPAPFRLLVPSRCRGLAGGIDILTGGAVGALPDEQREKPMPKLRVQGLTMSLDGYVAGADQGQDNPLGVGGGRLHEWMFATRTARRTLGLDGGDEDIDDDFVAQGDVGVGAAIMGRNMFGPIRGPWDGQQWNGWWGDNPPYHTSVFVLTHHPRPSVAMEGGTTFHFVTDGIGAALERAFTAADGKDVRLYGGAATVQQYLRAGLIDDLHLVIAPVLLGDGERLFDHLDGGTAGYECIELISSPAATHARLARVGRHA